MALGGPAAQLRRAVWTSIIATVRNEVGRGMLSPRNRPETPVVSQPCVSLLRNM